MIVQGDEEAGEDKLPIMSNDSILASHEDTSKLLVSQKYRYFEKWLT